MKKLILLATILLSSIGIHAQDLTYGATFGTAFYDIDGDQGVFSSGELSKIPINLGGHINYKLNNHYGIKTALTLSFAEEDYDLRSLINKLAIKKTTLNLTPHFKFDTNGNYNKGFYLLAGPRLSFILSSKSDDGDSLDDFYKSTAFGIQFGFGMDFLDHFSVELIGDYGLSDYLDFEENTNVAGAYLNLNVNLESLINK